LALVFTACPDAGSSDGGGGVDPYAGLPQRTFYAQNYVTKQYYTVNAVQLRRGSICEVWADRNAGISTDTAAAIVNEFETRINGPMVSAFGSYNYVNNTSGRLVLLLLDIQDGFSGSGGYVGGYFNASDLFARDAYNPYSNQAAMLYIDTNPGLSHLPACYETIAHELQHLINLNNSAVYRLSGNEIIPQDTWINEGLSSAAEYIYRGRQHTNGRLEDFNASASVGQGNNFFVWGENPANILDEYATVYLFFQWLRVQSGGETIYKTIGQSPEDTYKAVTKAVSSWSLPGWSSGDTDPVHEGNWEILLRSWFAANYLKNSTGPYGYGSDSLNTTIQVKNAAGGTTIQLWPGEGVYSTITGTKSFSNSAPISYAGLSGSTVSTGGSYSGKLLTFNKKVVADYPAYYNSDGSPKFPQSPGSLASSVVSAPSPSLNTRQAVTKPKIYPVSPGDLKGRDRIKTIPLGTLGAGDE
jgi:hypothetical protein